MPRITLSQVQQAVKLDGEILTDAEIEERRQARVEKAATPSTKKKVTRKKIEQVETTEVVKKTIPKKTTKDYVDVFADTKELNEKFFGDVNFNKDYERLSFEISRWKEELNETIDAVNKGDAEGVVDGAIDLITFVIGTLDHFGVNGALAWKRVHEANMAKEKGTKSTRPDSKGIDLVKPAGWQAPHHDDNVGLLAEALDFS